MLTTPTLTGNDILKLTLLRLKPLSGVLPIMYEHIPKLVTLNRPPLPDHLIPDFCTLLLKNL